MKVRKIAISTGGGDAPGLNAVIRAVGKSAARLGWECLGIRDGYNGVLAPEDYPEGGLIELNPARVQGITHLGGTILGTTNKGNPFHYPVRQADGSYARYDAPYGTHMNIDENVPFAPALALFAGKGGGGQPTAPALDPSLNGHRPR